MKERERLAAKATAGIRFAHLRVATLSGRRQKMFEAPGKAQQGVASRARSVFRQRAVSVSLAEQATGWPLSS